MYLCMYLRKVLEMQTRKKMEMLPTILIAKTIATVGLRIQEK